MGMQNQPKAIIEPWGRCGEKSWFVAKILNMGKKKLCPYQTKVSIKKCFQGVKTCNIMNSSLKLFFLFKPQQNNNI